MSLLPNFTLVLLLLVLLALPGRATVGVDISQPVSEAMWKCLQKPGQQGAVQFAIARVFEETGHVDQNGIASIKAATAAGIPHVDGYIFPCFKCGNPAEQISTTMTALANAGVQIGMLWYDIEGNDWGSVAENQAFVKEMVDAGKKLGISAGVYTNWNSWSSIVGRSYNYARSQGLPNWYAHYDNSKSFSDFQSFGGWTKPNMKQYIGNAQSCGAGVDYNWYPDSSAVSFVATGTTAPMNDTTSLSSVPASFSNDASCCSSYPCTKYQVVDFGISNWANRSWYIDTLVQFYPPKTWSAAEGDTFLVAVAYRNGSIIANRVGSLTSSSPGTKAYCQYPQVGRGYCHSEIKLTLAEIPRGYKVPLQVIFTFDSKMLGRTCVTKPWIYNN